MHNEQNIIGKRLYEALALRGKLQKELACELGLIDNTISYFVSGKRTPNTELLIKISRYLDVSVDYLLGLTDIPSTNADLRATCEYTGLSQVAVMSLRYNNVEKPKSHPNEELVSESIQALNVFLSHYIPLLSISVQYKHQIKKVDKAKKEFDILFKEMKLPFVNMADKIKEIQVLEKEARLLMFEAAEQFKDFSEKFAYEEV